MSTRRARVYRPYLRYERYIAEFLQHTTEETLQPRIWLTLVDQRALMGEAAKAKSQRAMKDCAGCTPQHLAEVVHELQ